jgi:hypothetical protein
MTSFGAFHQVTSEENQLQAPISYRQAIQVVVEKDGLSGLFGRGLKTRIVANGIQGLMFSVLWKLINDAAFGSKSA